MQSTKSMGAVILAAGASARMGSPKQLLIYRGQSLVRRAALSALQAGARPVVVVVGCAADEIVTELAGMDVEIAPNDSWPNGIGSSIAVGFERLAMIAPESTHGLILLCDQAAIAADDLVKIMHAAQSSTKPICVSEYADTIGPPVVVSRECFGELSVLSGDRGAKHLWTNDPSRIERITMAAAALDVDTPEDFEKLKAGEKD